VSVCCECRVFLGRGLCDGPITRPEESCRLWCVIVCDVETAGMRRSWPALGCCARGKKIYIYIYILLGGRLTKPCSIPSRSKGFSILQYFLTDYGTNRRYCRWCRQHLSWELSGRYVKLITHVRVVPSFYICTPLYMFVACCLIKHRSNVTLIFRTPLVY
jgi:hypothetical protein